MMSKILNKMIKLIGAPNNQSKMLRMALSFHENVIATPHLLRGKQSSF
jgi:tRNA A22 N-methylase